MSPQVCGVVALSVMRLPKSLMASPLGVDMDTHEVTFTNGTYFRQVARHWALYYGLYALCDVCTLYPVLFFLFSLPCAL